jgi:hypothetical protein
VIYCFLLCNIIKGSWNATDEEKLIKLVVEFKDHLSVDLEAGSADPDPDKDNLEVLYPMVTQESQVKAKLFMGKGGYRHLCCVLSFFLGIVMLSCVQWHHIHAPWFKVIILDHIKYYSGISVFLLLEDDVLITGTVYCGIYNREH